MNQHLINRNVAVFPAHCGFRFLRSKRLHRWRNVGRKVLPTDIGNLFQVRFECERCGVRGILTTPHSDHLWLLGVEAPVPDEVSP